MDTLKNLTHFHFQGLSSENQKLNFLFYFIFIVYLILLPCYTIYSKVYWPISYYITLLMLAYLFYVVCCTCRVIWYFLILGLLKNERIMLLSMVIIACLVFCIRKTNDNFWPQSQMKCSSSRVLVSNLVSLLKNGRLAWGVFIAN